MRDVNHSIVRPPETADPIADAHEIMRWAHDTYGDGLCLTASFGDATLVHLANVVVPGIEITLLDTGYLFAETEWFADDLRNRLINIFRRDDKGRRAVFGGYEKMQTDPHFKDYLLFHEYYDGDTGRGLGASHQTGWSALVANMIAELHE